MELNTLYFFYKKLQKMVQPQVSKFFTDLSLKVSKKFLKIFTIWAQVSYFLKQQELLPREISGF